MRYREIPLYWRGSTQVELLFALVSTDNRNPPQNWFNPSIAHKLYQRKRRF